MVRLAALLLAIFMAIVTGFSGLDATAQEAVKPSTIAPAPLEDGSVMFMFAIVEGERIEIRQTLTAEGIDHFDARPIIEKLKGQITTDTTVLKVLRFQDGAEISIDMADGRVEANGQELGLIPEWRPRELADTWLDANAIAILTGTEVSKDDDGTLHFTLDDRLRPQFDLDLWVNGELIPVGDIEPRTIGPVLLLPLPDVVNALGHSLEIDETTGLITVIRVQDTARITIAPNTGAIAVNDRFVGVTPNISYAVPEDLLFPSTAVETLTGTHIKLRPGTNRVDVELDDRIRSAVLPDAFVLDQAKETPFTLERLDYQLATNGPQAVSLSAHGGTLNGIGTVTTAGGLQTPGGLHPSTIAIDLESLRGWRSSLGDITDPFRELSGSGASRVRGVGWQRQSEDGDIVAITAGAPLSGSRRVSDSVTTPTFSGFAAGARLIRPDKSEEIGVAAALAGSDGRLVATAQKLHVSDRPRDKAGLKSASATVGLGAFQGNAPNAVDVDVRASGGYQLSKQSRLRVSGGYRGASFLTRPGRTDTGERSAVGAQTNARVSLDWRAKRDWSILKEPTAVSRVSMAQSGGRNSQSMGVSVGGWLQGIGSSVAADVNRSMAQAESGERGTATTTSIRVFRRFNWGDGQLVAQSNQTDEDTENRLIATLNGKPITRFIGKGGVVSLSPSASVVSDSENLNGRLGASVSADSGSTFGDKFRMAGQLTAAQSLDPDTSAPELFANVSGAYALNRYVRLTGSVGQSLGGARSFFLTLTGSAPFNPPRKHTLPRDGRGVLNGRVFLDRNRDGVRQEDEPGLAGITVSLNNTRLQLAADRDGYYTIQNLRSGLYTLKIDRRSLPLGVMISEATSMRATVAPGQITTLDVPVIISGQIRGSIYVDEDGSGDRSAGDPRLEGAFVELQSESDRALAPTTQYAASFGQYAFESLGPGDYTITVEYGGRRVKKRISVDEDSLLQVVDIEFPSTSDTITAPDKPSGGGGVILGTAP